MPTMTMTSSLSTISEYNVRSQRTTYKSMQRLSSNDRLIDPAASPRDLASSEMYRFQMRVLDESNKGNENVNNCVASADQYLQGYQDLGLRLRELAASACDGSKSTEDRQMLDQEHILLKKELSTIAAKANYNGIKICGADQMLTYDNDRKTFAFAQIDGSEKYHLPVAMMSGLRATNGVDFMIDPTNSYSLSGDGRNIFYVNSQDQLACYEIDSNSLRINPTTLADAQLHVDNQARLWYATKVGTNYTLGQMNISTWQQSSSAPSITNMQLPEFKVYQDRVYYLSDDQVISQNIINSDDWDVKFSVNDLPTPINTTQGQFALSSDGLYIADVVLSGASQEIRVTNMQTKKTAMLAVSASNIENLSFGVDNREVVFFDATSKTPYAMSLDTFDTFSLQTAKAVLSPTASLGFQSFSVQGSSNRARLAVHTGASPKDVHYVQMVDVRLSTLGLSQTSLASPAQAKEALAQIEKAMDLVSLQRSNMGSQAESLRISLESAASQSASLSKSYARLRDPDVAEEIARQTQSKIQYETNLNLFTRVAELERLAISMLAK